MPNALRLSVVWMILSGLTFVGAGSPPPGGADAGWAESGRSGSDTEIRGRVMDTEGQALGAATIRLMHDGRSRAFAASDDDGGFRLVVPEALRGPYEAGSLRLRVERLGYESREVLLDPAEPTVEVALVRAPLPLRGFEVEGLRGACDSDDGARLGRTLWERASARHPGGLDTLGVATYTLSRTDTLAEADLIPVRTNGPAPEFGQRGSAPILRLGWSRRIDRAGYAFPVRRTDRHGSFASWSYPPLESDFAPHFGSEQFGSLHHFQHLSEGADGWWIRFCSRDEDRPHLEGQIQIGPDTLIRRVEWAVRTPEPDEHAGGVVVFPDPDAGGAAPSLLPAESMVWMAPRGEDFIRKAQWFEDWRTAPGDSVPFLPRRMDHPTSDSDSDPESEGFPGAN